MRTTKAMLKQAEKDVNFYLKNTRVIVASRYGYKAIDIAPKDKEKFYVITTIAAGLSSGEAYRILSSFVKILSTDKWEG